MLLPSRLTTQTFTLTIIPSLIRYNFLPSSPLSAYHHRRILKLYPPVYSAPLPYKSRRRRPRQWMAIRCRRHRQRGMPRHGDSTCTTNRRCRVLPPLDSSKYLSLHQAINPLSRMCSKLPLFQRPVPMLNNYNTHLNCLPSLRMVP